MLNHNSRSSVDTEMKERTPWRGQAAWQTVAGEDRLVGCRGTPGFETAWKQRRESQAPTPLASNVATLRTPVPRTASMRARAPRTAWMPGQVPTTSEAARSVKCAAVQYSSACGRFFWTGFPDPRRQKVLIALQLVIGARGSACVRLPVARGAFLASGRTNARLGATSGLRKPCGKKTVLDTAGGGRT